MKKLLVTIFLISSIFLTNSSNAYDIISCQYKNINIAEHIKKDIISNATPEEQIEYGGYFDILFPLDVEIDFIHKSKTRWQMKSIKTNIRKNMELFLNQSVEEKLLSRKEADEQLKIMGNIDDQIFEMFNTGILSNAKALDVLPDEKINIDPENGKPLGNSIILSFTTDAAYYFRTKFNYNDINKYNNFKTELKTIGTDGTVHISSIGNCTNTSLKKNNSIDSTNSDDDISSKLKKLKSLFEEELITQEEYDAKRKEILDEM